MSLQCMKQIASFLNEISDEYGVNTNKTSIGR